MRLVTVTLCLLTASLAVAKSTPRSACLDGSGAEAAACLESYLSGSSAEPAFTDGQVRDHCDEDTTYALGALGVDDLVLVLRNACTDFGHELFTIGSPTPNDAATGRERKCRKFLPRALRALRKRTITTLGPRCAVRVAAGQTCDRSRQDTKASAFAGRIPKSIARACGSTYENLGLPPVETLVGTYFNRVRHFAQLAYPPNDLGPSSDLGSYPVGVRTLELADQSRMNVQGTGPRPVTVEIWYPSTAAAVAGVERYVVNLFGLDVARTPTYRDVARAPGSFPIVLFSHGNSGIRFQSIYLATHLASHGYIVVSPDHHGNTFLDIGGGVIDELPQSAINRPLDMKFLLDEVLARNGASGDFLEGAVDTTRIGMSGHSFGGYTTFALAAGTYAEPRIGAFLPQAPASLLDATFYGMITAPILIQGGSLDVTTPYDSEQLAPYQALPSGASVVGLAQIVDAAHFTYSDNCEVPRELVTFVGGFDEACIPKDIPWRHAHDLINYLALNFFDATLNHDAEALGRLAPEVVVTLGDVNYQRK